VDFNIVGITLVFAEATSRPRPYVQPRSRKIRSKIGIGIPRSQSKMYPVAPASLILVVKRISDFPLLVTLNCAQQLAWFSKTNNRAVGWLSSQTKSYPPFIMKDELGSVPPAF
jgi:hypothetical protein